MGDFMTFDLSIILLATLVGSITLGLMLCMRISLQCTRVIRMARIAGEAEAIVEARRLATKPTVESAAPSDS